MSHNFGAKKYEHSNNKRVQKNHHVELMLFFWNQQVTTLPPSSWGAGGDGTTGKKVCMAPNGHLRGQSRRIDKHVPTYPTKAFKTHSNVLWGHVHRQVVLVCG